MTDPHPRPHLALGALGGAAGLAFHVLSETLRQGLLPERPALGVAAFALVFFVATLGMAGPVPLRRALASALPLAAVVATLILWASLRYVAPRDLLGEAIPVLSAVALTLLPLPFLIARAQGNWRHYPTLFAEAWGSVIRQAAGWLFVGVVWLVYILSNELLQIVGLHWLDRLVEFDLFIAVFTGAMLGLGIAVMQDMPGLVAPDLIIRLMRLMVPALLVVLVIFLLAVPLRGVDALFTRVSAATVLLFIAGLGVSLITAAVERSPAEATASVLVGRAAQALAVLTVLPAGLGIWAIWQRVAQYGWTPERVLALCVAGLCLGYGLLYLAAVLRGGGWQARIRRANLTMALIVIALAALLLTPAVNPERLSVASQVARLDRGEVSAEGLDLKAISRWGRPGEAAIAALRARKDDASLRAALARFDGTPDPALEAQRRAELAQMVPLRPASETAMRSAVLGDLGEYELDSLRKACARRVSGLPGCVLLVADFLPDLAGHEALLVQRTAVKGLDVEGFYLQAGRIQRLAVPDAVRALRRPADRDAEWQALLAGDPVLRPVAVQMLEVGTLKIMLMPPLEGNR